MKALTVQQPWAWAIIHGGKDVENRTTAWSYRGPLAIHAGARLSERGCEEIPDLLDRTRPHLLGAYADARMVYGAIIGVVDLVDVHHHIGSGDRVDCCDSPWAESWYPGAGRLTHLVLANPRIIGAPVPCKGRLGLWDVPRDTLLDIQAELSPANGGPW